MSRTSKLSYWSDIVNSYLSSGLSVKNFCRQECINCKQFYRWRQKLLVAEIINPSPPATKKEESKTNFVKLNFTEEEHAAAQYNLDSGLSINIGIAKINIETGFNSLELSKVLEVLLSHVGS